MDYVARAKALFNSGAAIGLIIVPLAAAVPAFGGTTALPTTDFNCSQTDGTGSVNCNSGASVSQLPVISGVEGVKFFGPSSGSYSFTDFSSSGSTASLAFSTFGQLSGSSIASGTSLPLIYDFNINGAGSGSFTGWELEYIITGPGNISLELPQGASALDENSGQTDIFSPGSNFGGLQSGTANLQVTNTLNANSNVGVDVTLLIFGAGSGLTVNVSVPSSSFDVNNITATPEPASGTLAGLCLTLAGGYFLVRRRRGFVLVKIGILKRIRTFR